MVASPQHHRARCCLLLAVLGSAGCAIEVPKGWESELRRSIADSSDRFAAGQRILSGMAPLSPDAKLAAGDEVLFGICLEVDGRRKIWYLDVRVVAITTVRGLDFGSYQPFLQRVEPSAAKRAEMQAESKKLDLGDLMTDIPMARVRVEAFDADGRSLEVDESDAVEWRLRRGLVPACLAGYRLRDVMRGRVALGLDAQPIELSDADYRDAEVAASGASSCEQFFHILRSNSVTRSILYEVIALPSLWSMIRRLGASADIALDFFAAERVEAARYPGTDRELWSIPVTILLNDQPALLACLIAETGGAPDGAAAGIFAVVGRHPGDPGRRVVVQMLASRRAEPRTAGD